MWECVVVYLNANNVILLRIFFFAANVRNEILWTLALADLIPLVYTHGHCTYIYIFIILYRVFALNRKYAHKYAYTQIEKFKYLCNFLSSSPVSGAKFRTVRMWVKQSMTIVSACSLSRIWSSFSRISLSLLRKKNFRKNNKLFSLCCFTRSYFDNATFFPNASNWKCIFNWFAATSLLSCGEKMLFCFEEKPLGI